MKPARLKPGLPRKGLCRPRRPAAPGASPCPQRVALRERGLRGAAPSLPAQAWTSPKGCRLWRLHGGAKRHRGVFHFIDSSEPMPLGVFMLVQVPAGTYFQELLW